jgi:TolB-like protein
MGEIKGSLPKTQRSAACLSLVMGLPPGGHKFETVPPSQYITVPSFYRVHSMRQYAPPDPSFEVPSRALKLDSVEAGIERPDRHGKPADAEAVRPQLAKILRSSTFSSLTKTKQFLAYIVEETLAGNGRKLKQYNIATEAFGRDASFDPELDPVVRLEAGKLRKALENYYHNDGAFDRIRVLVPKGGYIPSFVAAEPPNVAVTPASVAPVLDQRRLLVVTPAGTFEGEDCRPISIGLFEQLIVELTRYNDVSVVSCDALGSGSHFDTPFGLGGAHSARFVVTSSARQSGAKVRVTVRLHDVQAQAIIWTESFDFDVKSDAVIDVQDRVARRVAADIADYHGVICRLLSLQSAGEQSETWNLQTAIQRHRYLSRVTNERVYRRARSDLEYGIEAAPYHAMLWAALAHTVFTGNVVGFDKDADWLSMVDRYAQHSFELDQKCAFGHVVTATLGIYHRDLEGTLETCRRIMEDNPHAPSTQLSAGFFRSLAGDWETGASMLSGALEMISHPPGWAFRATFLNLYRQRDYARALFEIKKYHATEHFTPSLLRAAALGQLGRLEEARMAATEVQRICPQFPELADRYFRSLSGFDSLSDHLKEGLQKAGLAL